MKLSLEQVDKTSVSQRSEESELIDATDVEDKPKRNRFGWKKKNLVDDSSDLINVESEDESEDGLDDEDASDDSIENDVAAKAVRFSDVSEMTDKKAFGLKPIDKERMLELGYGYQDIVSWQKSRLLLSGLLVVATVLYATTLPNTDWVIVAIMLVLSWLLYIQKLYSMRREWRTLRFVRQLDFAKFCRLLVPYLDEENANTSLNYIFPKIVDRMSHEEDKREVRILIKKMTDDSNNLQPFLDFAKNMSNTDFSFLFMMTLYDIKEGAADPEIIARLGTMASDEVVARMKDIKRMKLAKFNKYTYVMAVSIVLFLMGYFLAIGADMFQNMF